MNESKAHVYKKGLLAGTLSQDGEFTTFEYLQEYVDSDGPAVASSLKVNSEPVVRSGGSTPPFFAGLLPEGRRLIAIANRLQTSLDDDLGLLLEIGADLIGDVQVLPIGGDPNSSREILMLPKDLTEVSFESLRDEYFGSKASGLPGVQDKVSSKKLNARARLANLDYILKLNPQEVPFAVENEAFFLSLARKCDLKTANYTLLTDSNGTNALLLERFDRVASKTGKVRLAQEDGCQVMKLYPASKYNVDFIDLAKALSGVCTAKEVAAYNLFGQMVFSWLIGNGDAHAKNFSVLEGQAGEFKISPTYDLLCTRFYEDRGDRDMALRLNGLSAGWNRKFLLDSAEMLGVSRPAAEDVIDFQLRQLKDLPDQIISGALPFRRDQNYDVAAFLKQRAKALA